jgi:FkbM family methyltransferase
LINQIATTERLASGSKLSRFLHDPWSYSKAILHRKLIYPYTKKEIFVNKRLFFGEEMRLALPASTDIYLTGGKSHDSELRLTKYLAQVLTPQSAFLDIGAHYGFYTLLANNIMQGRGKIVSYEPTTATYNLLVHNTQKHANVKTYQMAVSDTTDDLVFYTFPNLQSEYNTSDVTQFENAKWYDPQSVQKNVIKATTIDNIVVDEQYKPNVIKIDVEGAEYKVLTGGQNFFSKNPTIVIIEYLAPSRSNESHVMAVELMRANGFVTYLIDKAGALIPIDNIDQFLIDSKLESDHVVFKKV